MSSFLKYEVNEKALLVKYKIPIRFYYFHHMNSNILIVL